MKKTKLTENKRIEFQQNEVTNIVQQGIGLYFQQERQVNFDEGNVHLTNKRIIWQSSKDANEAFEVTLCNIQRIENYAGFLASHPKITIYIQERQKQIYNWKCPICSFQNNTEIMDLPEKWKCMECGVYSGSSELKFNCPYCTFIQSFKEVTSWVHHQACEICGQAWKSKILQETFIKLAFRAGGNPLFFQKLQQVLSEKSETSLELSDKDRSSDPSLLTGIRILIIYNR